MLRVCVAVCAASNLKQDLKSRNTCGRIDDDTTCGDLISCRRYEVCMDGLCKCPKGFVSCDDGTFCYPGSTDNDCPNCNPPYCECKWVSYCSRFPYSLPGTTSVPGQGQTEVPPAETESPAREAQVHTTPGLYLVLLAINCASIVWSDSQ